MNQARQKARQQLYRVRFRAGSIAGPLWFRAVLSVDEPLRDDRGTGAFARGEVEDSLYGEDFPGIAFAECDAGLVQHGTSRFVNIEFFGRPEDGIVSAGLLLTKPFTPERVISREGVVNPKGTRASFTYTSLKKDGPNNPVVVDKFKVLVRARVGGRIYAAAFDCAVPVVHAFAPASGGPGGDGPGGGGPGDRAPLDGASRPGWYSGPTANFGSIDFQVVGAGSGKTVQKLQFTSRITCTTGVTSHHVHVDGSFPLRVSGKREVFVGTLPSFEIVGHPIGRPSGPSL